MNSKELDRGSQSVVDIDEKAKQVSVRQADDDQGR